ncbi:uncharacterized protein B0H18DRAFT_662681 [Fomitopsis serialis]|uniref:uncharacterized protein n=1 Tax=Fomitopsis serialis TaxID=139415 RepID=UPI0020077641|nr:uncharacterized protein B0H18DRAFT_662681 [Neoantrodia serialis]KAH9918654.1 hypothetical protein B0H18DRAFT_662681 [Neoantrodia serialis]
MVWYPCVDANGDGQTVSCAIDVLSLRCRQDYDQLSATELLQTERSLHLMLAEIHSRQNTMLPIHRMPPEVFKAIFEDALSRRTRYLDETAISWDYPVLGLTQLAKISSVCRYWRAIALGTPTLWTNISPGWMDRRQIFSRAATMFLERARDLPVDLVVDHHGHAGNLSSFITDLGPDFTSRLRRIHCRHAWEHLDIVFNFPAPRLESLYLDDTHTEVTATDVPLFGGQNPQLRYLSLSRMARMPTFQLPTLTHLHIHRCTDCGLSALLASTPGLTDLSLSEVGADSSNGTSPLMSPLHLRKLKRFALHGMCCSSVRAIMLYMAIPRSTALLFTGCDTLNAETMASSGLRDYLSSRAWTRMSIRPDEEGDFCSVTATDDHVGVSFDCVASKEHRDPDDWCFYDIGDMHWVIPPTMPPPFQSVRECWVMETLHAMNSFRASGLRDMLGSMCNLETLVVCAWSLKAVLEALSLPSQHDVEAGGTEVLVCPMLKELHILTTDDRGSRILDVLVDARFDRLRFLERVVLDYLPGSCASSMRDYRSDRPVDVVELTEQPEMPLPLVCSVEVHAFWPKWRPHTEHILGTKYETRKGSRRHPRSRPVIARKS